MLVSEAKVLHNNLNQYRKKQLKTQEVPYLKLNNLNLNLKQELKDIKKQIPTIKDLQMEFD